MQIGAKVDFKDFNLAVKLAGLFDYVEILYKSYQQPLVQKIQEIDSRWIVHGPTYGDGVNLSANDEKGINLTKESIEFAKAIGAKRIVVHPGRGSSEEFSKFLEIYKQIVEFTKKRGVEVLIENEIPREEDGPYFVRTPEEVKKIMEETGCGFVLDFSHAQLMSVVLKRDFYSLLNDFMKLNPTMFHLVDGIMGKNEDMHLPLGEGNFDIKRLFSLVGEKDVTLECWPWTLETFSKAKDYIKKIVQA